MNVPICKNCKYKSQLMGTAMCNRPTDVISVITGGIDTKYVSCASERMSRIDKCGLDGAFFVPSTWFKVKQKVKSLVS